MGKIEERTTKTHTIYYYEIAEVYDKKSALDWIFERANSGIIQVEYIFVEDLVNRSDEGSISEQLLPNVSKEEFLAACNHGDIEVVTLSGKFQGQLVTVSINLKEFFVIVPTRKKSSVDYELLFKLLKLE